MVSSMLNMLRAMICTSLSVDSGSGDLEISARNWSSKLLCATGKSSVSIWVYSLPWDDGVVNNYCITASLD